MNKNLSLVKNGTNQTLGHVGELPAVPWFSKSVGHLFTSLDPRSRGDLIRSCHLAKFMVRPTVLELSTYPYA